MNLYDPDAKVTKMKDGRTHLAHKAEHAVDAETGAIVALTLQGADQGDTTTIVETATAAAEQVEEAQADVEEPQALEEIVADKGYHSNQTLIDLDAVEIRSYIAEPDRGRRDWRDAPEAQAPVYGNRRRVRGRRGRRLMRRRGETIERSFAHLYDTGGMRRTHLRGHPNILKRLLIHAGAFNLGLIMRQVIGIGTPRGLQGRAAACVGALFAHIFGMRWRSAALWRVAHRIAAIRASLATSVVLTLKSSATATKTTGCYGSSVPCVPFTACPDGRGYVPLVARELGSDGTTVTLTNLGIPGAVLSPAIQAIGNQYNRGIPGNFLDQEMPFVPRASTIVSIFAGANDTNTIGTAVDRGAGGSDPNGYIDGQVRAFASDYAALVRGIRQRAPGARIVAMNLPNLAGLPYTAGFTGPQKRHMQRISVGFSREGANALVAEGVVVIDAGYAVLAQARARHSYAGVSVAAGRLLVHEDCGMNEVGPDFSPALTSASLPARVARLKSGPTLRAPGSSVALHGDFQFLQPGGHVRSRRVGLHLAIDVEDLAVGSDVEGPASRKAHRGQHAVRGGDLLVGVGQNRIVGLERLRKPGVGLEVVHAHREVRDVELAQL